MQAHVAELRMLYRTKIAFDYSEPTLGRKMIGVILWSDPTDRKAVIWCEDQGDLAYYALAGQDPLPDPFFDVGDVVEFDVTTERDTRIVKNAARLKQSWGATLTAGLRAMGDGGPAPVDTGTTAQIIPFRADPATRPVPWYATPRQRRG